MIRLDIIGDGRTKSVFARLGGRWRLSAGRAHVTIGPLTVFWMTVRRARLEKAG